MTEALKLLLTGMGTVFFILIMVVLLGNLIIIITNKFEVTPVVVSSAKSSSNSDLIESRKLAAIVSAVDIATQGKGKVSSIEKIN